MKYLMDGTETERLIFRMLQESDFDTWLQFFRDPRSLGLWKGVSDNPRFLCERWFTRNFTRYQQGTGGMNVIVDKYNGEFIGQCGLLIQAVDGNEELEVAYSIMPACRNQGFASEAAAKCIEHAFKNRWRESLISIIHQSNTESSRVAHKNNLILEKTTVYDNNRVNIYRIEREWYMKQVAGNK